MFRSNINFVTKSKITKDEMKKCQDFLQKLIDNPDSD